MNALSSQKTMSILETLLPRARAEIVRLLFSDPGKELHQRELARLSNLAIRTLQNEVAKLEGVDLLVSRRDGNRLYFRANTDHPIYPELHGIAIKTTGLKERLADALSGFDGVSLAFVFGSIASGEDNAGSDIDLMVIGKVGLRDLAPRLRPLAEELGREINPHTFSKSHFRERSRLGDAFVGSVLEAPKIFIVGEADELKAMA